MIDKFINETDCPALLILHLICSNTTTFIKNVLGKKKTHAMEVLTRIVNVRQLKIAHNENFLVQDGVERLNSPLPTDTSVQSYSS